MYNAPTKNKTKKNLESVCVPINFMKRTEINYGVVNVYLCFYGRVQNRRVWAYVFFFGKNFFFPGTTTKLVYKKSMHNLEQFKFQ